MDKRLLCFLCLLYFLSLLLLPFSGRTRAPKV